MSPVVLHHGLLGGGMGVGPIRWRSFLRIDRALREAGYDVFNTDVHPTAGIETRANQLKKLLLTNRKKWGGQRIVLVAHSLGGLDARYMLSELGMAEIVKALVTIATPHRGTPWADWLVANVGKRLRAFRFCDWIGWDVQAATDCTTASCREFNQRIKDVDGVDYYSVSTAQEKKNLPVFGRFSWQVVYDAEGPNDGQVSVASSQWARHLGTWRTDHWHSTNRRYSREAWRVGDISPWYLQMLKRIDSNGETEEKT